MYVCCTELTAIYVTARTSDTQHAAMMDLDAVRKNTDRSLAELAEWPPADSEVATASQVSAMFRSRHMFTAILAGHRTSVRVGAYFWDEVDLRLCLYACIVTTGWAKKVSQIIFAITLSTVIQFS